MASGPRYPNQQLQSVSLETYFPGRLRVLSALGEVQDAVEAEFPNLFVPNVQPGEAVALRPFQLRDAVQKKSLAIAVNQATFVSFDYPGYEAFAAEGVRLLAVALGAIGPRQLNRVVFRYENVIGMSRHDDGTLPAEAIFPGIVPSVFGGQPGARPAKTINSAYEHPCSAAQFKGVRGFHARAEDVEGVTAFKLTVFGAVENCATGALAEATAAAHEIGFTLFEQLISEPFRTFISSSRRDSA